MKLRSLAIALFAFAFAFAIAPDARADAASEYDAGTRAFESGDYVEAARAFERADAMAAHPRARYNAALSWDRAHDSPRAADAYAAALDGKGLDRERTEAAQRRLQELTKQLGAIDVRRPSGGKVTVAHVVDAKIPVRVHVAPGVHKVELVASDGTHEQREIDVHVGERVVLEIAITSVPLAPSPPPAQPVAVPPPSGPARDERSDASSARTTWGFVALGGAVAFGAGAAIFGARMSSAIDDFDASGDRDGDARDRAVRYRALMWGAGGASLACATVGIVLLAGGKSETKTARAPRWQFGVGRSGIAARVRF